MIKLHRFFALMPLLLASMVYAGNVSADTKRITVVAPEWKGATEKDGSGFYFDLVRKAFAPANYKIIPQIMSYTEAEAAVGSCSADMMLVVFRGEQSQRIYPRWHMDNEKVTAVYKKGSVSEWKGLSSLSGKKTVWIVGYGYHRVIIPRHPMKWMTVQTQQEGLDAVNRGVVDFYIDESHEVDSLMKSIKPAERERYETHLVSTVKLFPAFCKNERGRRLAALWDKRIAAMVDGGTMEGFFKEGGYADYPYAKH